MTPGLTRGLKKGLRTIGQVIVGGGATALVAALADGLSPRNAALLLGAFTALAAFLQNYGEGSGHLPVLLPTPSLIPGPAAVAVATVDAAAGQTGEIVGDVLDTAGDVVGEITGQLDDPDNEGAA